MRSKVIISILLILLAVSCNHWIVGWAFSPTGKVEAFETKVFLWLLGGVALFVGIFVYFKGDTRQGRKHLLYYLMLIVLALAAIELFVRLFSGIIEARTGNDYREGKKSKIASKIQLSPYRQKEWAKAYFDELYGSGKSKYQSYYLWSRCEREGKYINIAPDGTRKTWNPDFAPGDEPKEIYVMGGSTVWGDGARDDYTIPSCLSRMLNEDDRLYRVKNYGESGHTLAQELVRLIMLLRDGKRPDFVVFYDGVNEVYAAYKTRIPGADMMYHSFQKLFEAQTPVHYNFAQDVYIAVTGILTKHCETYQQISQIPNVYHSIMSKEKGSAVQRKQKGPTKRRIFTERAAYIDTEKLQNLSHGIVSSYVDTAKVIDFIAKAYGFDYVLFWQPVIFTEKHVDEEEATANRFDNRTLGFLYEKTYEDVRSRKINNFFDISDALQDRTGTVYIDFCHLSEEGNAIVTRRILEILERKGLKAKVPRSEKGP